QEATYESAWKLIQENAKGIREMKKERRKDWEKSRKDWEEIRQKFKEMRESLTRTEKMIENTNKETRENLTRTEKMIENTNKETRENLTRMIENTNKQIGGISRSNGEFCEEYFINSFKENPTFMGEKYDYVVEYLRPYPNTVIADEYDLILHNGSTVVIIEMKYKASIEDVGKMFSKLHSYRANYPMNKDYKVYLALASFRFPAKVRQRADEEGIVLIEQRGEKIEVISKKVKTW
ncbi:MAG: hypothetical protein FWG79_05285, partial [Bacteroidales bacterium]|nr:hypothetical protein [Bacteroidales bacterium]